MLSAAVFVLSSIFRILALRPLAYFSERDPRKCPGYGEVEMNDALAACISAANDAQRNWLKTSADMAYIADAALPTLLLLSPLAVLLIARSLRRSSASRPI